LFESCVRLYILYITAHYNRDVSPENPNPSKMFIIFVLYVPFILSTYPLAWPVPEVEREGHGGRVRESERGVLLRVADSC